MSDFIHTPSTTTVTPESFFDPDTGVSYEVVPDETPTDPRDDLGDLTNDLAPQVFVYDACRNGVTDLHRLSKFNDLTYEFITGINEYGQTADQALKDVIGSNTSATDGITVVGMVETVQTDQSSWFSVVMLIRVGPDSPSHRANSDYTRIAAINTLDAILDQYTAYAAGNVWRVSPDIPNAYPLSGIYADDAEAALKVYLADNPVPEPDVPTVGPSLIKNDITDFSDDRHMSDTYPGLTPEYRDKILAMSDDRLNRVIAENFDDRTWWDFVNGMKPDIISALIDQLNEHGA